MQFTIRTLCLVSVFVAAVCAEVVNQIRCERRCRECERLVREVNIDMHDHLRDFGKYDRKTRDTIDTHELWWQQMHYQLPDVWKRLEVLESSER